ncbi:cytochrome b [Pseudomonas sp. H3(2019)]|uniref:cytochrome b n=1 Tax=Pseudomonas sp. H3(2019) TaxID=2598724 RepID=UPI0011972F67|nr:cytochrome b/b6 domain-containing protein [Pseudomonas sp. H3(2019)]TVT83255.1 cytochrome B [Pseudomonas sp. H3(2019)]
MKTSSYTGVQKFLHWLSAVIIVWALVSGFYVSLFEVAVSVKEWVAFVNVSLTTAFLPFFALRLYLSLRRRRSDTTKQRTFIEALASCVHGLIYLVVSVVLVTGILMMDRGINVFDFLSIPQPLEDPYWTSVFMNVHVWACIALAVMIALHITAVIKHEVSGRRVLVNMWFHR